MSIFDPIQAFVDVITYNWLGFDHHSFIGESLNYFIFDVIKIGLLLVLINYLMAFVRYYLPMDKVKAILTKRRWYGLDYLLAALLGMITPFCSCSSIPLFIGFVGAGVPLGVTFAFLISSPLVNEASLYLFPALFGFNMTLIYNSIGVLVAIGGGLLIQRLKLEKYIRPELLQITTRNQTSIKNEVEKLPFRKLAVLCWHDGMHITKQVFPYVLLGVALGSLIHGFVPAGFVEKYLSMKTWWSVPVATILGAPLYANSVGVMPIMEALVEKGVPLGTALAFMTSIVTISLPEILILKKVMKWQLLAVFVSITVVGIMLMGYVMNCL